MDVRNVFDVLGAGASIAAIVGVVIQLYLVRRDARQRATVPVGVREQPSASVATTPVPSPPGSQGPPEIQTSPTSSTTPTSPAPAPQTSREPPTLGAKPGATDSGWGAFF